MDFMKVFDQTVREIKREVNLKVLKVPEIEQKVLDATDDEPWGPHGSALAEIAQATKKFTECQMIMNVLWTRLSETCKNWRVVYKALAVLEYLVGHGSERAVDEIVEHTFQISSLTSFEYVELSGKDVGLNVRKKAENIVALLKDRDKIQETRNKASANREKYIGLSSTGATYKSSSASSGSSSIHSSGRYGGTSNTRDSRSFRDAYKDRDSYGEKDAFPKSRRSGSYDDQEKKSSIRVGSKKQGDAKLPSNSGTSQRVSAPSNSDDEFDDDFDPRGTSIKSASGTSNQVDLFGQSLIGDLMDVAETVTSEIESSNGSSSEVDLFADAAFISAPSQVETSADSHSQVDLFASRPAIPSVAPATIDFFSAADTALQPETTAPKPEPTNATVADPFAAVSMNSFEGSDLFGAFNSGSNSASTEAAQSSVNDISIDNVGVKSSVDSNPQSKQGAFQVKSGIWADSLTRGLIDLNISAPKKVSLVDVGVVGDLSDGQAEMVKGPPVAFYMGRAMGTGSGLGKTGFQPSQESQSQAADVGDFFSSLGSQHYQFGNSNK